MKKATSPDCWAQRMGTDRQNKSNLFGGCDYSWGIDGDIIWLKDNCGPGRSLTNDMENALARIQPEVDRPLNTFTIVYRDSDAAWDGVRLKHFDMKAVLTDAQWLLDGRYPHYFSKGLEVDFYFIGGKTYEQAKQKLQTV